MNSQGLIILSPGFTRESNEFDLLDFRLRHQAHWYDGDQRGNTMEGHTPQWDGIILLEYTSQELKSLLKEAAQQKINVQLVTLVSHLKRIRCNTPFVPGNHTERECAYIDRLFSYKR